MLLENHICKLQSQFFKQLQEMHMQDLKGDNISLVMPLSAMFAANTDMQYNFAAEAYKVFVLNGLCKETAFNTNYYQLSVYGVMMSNFVLGYDTHTGKTSLYTSSYRLLTHLATRGLLVCKKQPIAAELPRLEEVLVSGNRIPSSFKQRNTIQAVRLDWEYSDGRLVFNPCVPRSQLDLDRVVLMAYSAVDTAMRVMNDYLQDRVFEVTSGDKVRYVTKSTQVLGMIYGAQRAKYLSTATYDARTFKFEVPKVGASIYSSGFTNIDFAEVDRLRVLESITDIDMSELHLDTTLANKFVADKIRKGLLNIDEQRLLADELGIKYPAIASGIEGLLLKGLQSIPSYRVYDAMENLQSIFNLQEFKALPQRYSSPEQLPLPNSKVELDEILKKHAVKLTLRTKKGTTTSIVCTNNTDILKQLYGEDYFVRMESAGNRLRRLDYVLKTNYAGGISDTDLFKFLQKYNLMEVFQSIYLANGQELDFYTYEKVHTAILLTLDGVEERKTVVKQYDNTIARNCDCDRDSQYPANYYRSLNYRAIVSVVKVSVN